MKPIERLLIAFVLFLPTRIYPFIKTMDTNQPTAKTIIRAFKTKKEIPFEVYGKRGVEILKIFIQKEIYYFALEGATPVGHLTEKAQKISVAQQLFKYILSQPQCPQEMYSICCDFEQIRDVQILHFSK